MHVVLDVALAGRNHHGIVVAVEAKASGWEARPPDVRFLMAMLVHQLGELRAGCVPIGPALNNRLCAVTVARLPAELKVPTPVGHDGGRLGKRPSGHAQELHHVLLQQKDVRHAEPKCAHAGRNVHVGASLVALLRIQEAPERVHADGLDLNADVAVHEREDASGDAAHGEDATQRIVDVGVGQAVANPHAEDADQQFVGQLGPQARALLLAHLAVPRHLVVHDFVDIRELGAFGVLVGCVVVKRVESVAIAHDPSLGGARLATGERCRRTLALLVGFGFGRGLFLVDAVEQALHRIVQRPLASLSRCALRLIDDGRDALRPTIGRRTAREEGLLWLDAHDKEALDRCEFFKRHGHRAFNVLWPKHCAGDRRRVPARGLDLVDGRRS